jgi:hypothetical protein
MPVDDLGRRAANELRAAAALSDEIAALQAVTGTGRPRWSGPRLIVVCVIAALLVVSAAVVRVQLNPGASVSPAGQLAGTVVGEGLSVPVRFTVPADWTSPTDGAYVQLLPADGSDRSMTVTPATLAFDPPGYTTTSRPTDWILWTLSHPGLEVRGRFGDYGDGWEGSYMTLLLSGTATSPQITDRQVVPLVPLPGDAGSITISDDDQTFYWAVVTTREGRTLVAGRSSIPNDTELWDAFFAALKSIQAVPRAS